MKIRFTGLLLSTFMATGLFADGLDYPERYRELQLPEYSNATLTDVGRNSSSLSDGISITLSTVDNTKLLRKYYETEMSNRGWQLQETVATAKRRAAGLLDRLPFGAVFTKQGMRYQIVTHTLEDGTSIHISVVDE